MRMYLAGATMASSELSQQIEVVRKLAKPQLAHFSKLDADQCTESYLFKAEHFCGVKIILGAFEARWELGQSTIIIRRDATILQTLTIDDQSQQRAA